MAEQRRACASCGTANEEDARFCEGCGASFARTCATCGVEASASARFCRACGARLDGQSSQPPDVPAAGPVRKTVTVMFADLAGSTSFEERVDAETAREVIGRYHDLLRTTAERHRAGMTKYIGDGFMAVWGVPEIRPDDAGHAVDAAVELQERFVDLASLVAETHGVELDLRVAVNTGEVVVGAGDADLVGDALNVGARLESECPRGRVVVGEETWRATRGIYGYGSLGEVQVKGRTAPVTVYQWLGRQSNAADAAPFVGRSDEVRRLQAAMDDAVTARTARLVTVIGDPGVGKSRLAAEFTGAQSGVRIVDARCDLERTVALAPLVEVLRASDLEIDIPASIPERDRLLRDLNGLVTGIAGSVEENFWALRRFIEVLAINGPVVLVLDDIQWADTLLLDFVEHLVEWAAEVPVFVLALARPELREVRPDLVTVSRWVSEAVHLSGLDPTATAELAAKVLGAARLPDELLRRLPSTTGGNPLFVRELIGMLAHDGVLVQEATGWRLTIDVDAIAIPPTIHALLASRLERLDATDRRVLEIASVVGSEFSLGAVRALAGNVATAVALSLKRLRRLELAQPSGAYVGDEPVWRFHHVLIRDVAYRRLLKSDRADLHERLADWVATGGLSMAFDSDEMIARHLESAHTYRVELGTLDEHTGDLALRAARHYAASARRALDRDELLSAGAQAARGAALAAADGAVHAELLLIGCEAFLSAGDVAAGAPLVDDLDRIADETLAPWATCYRCQFVIYTDPERLLEMEARLQGAIDEFGRRNDPAGLAKAHRVRAGARSRLGRIGDCEADLFEALIAARHSGDHRQITAALGAAPGAALWGPSPVPKAGGRCLDVVRMQRMTTAAPSLEATSLRCLAVLELLRGRPDKARTMLADARQVVADLGLRHGLMETELFAGIIESMEGDPVAAEPHFRTALEGLEALGVGADAGQAAALLARSVLAQGRVDEADRHATVSERLAGRNLKTAIAWRAVRAEILAARGQHTEAAAMARDAVAVAAGTDLVIDHADACLALSRVLTVGGDAKGANGARDDAARLYAAKEVATAMRREAEPAPPPVTSPSAPAEPERAPRRLAVTNRSCEYLPAFLRALHAHDVDATLRWFSDDFVYDDRRRLSGDPVVGRDAMRAAIERIFSQYNHFDIRMLAVRGQRSHLLWTRWSDDDGNQTTTFYVNETGDDGRLIYHGRFDEDDFESAYREFESRYLAGEGVAVAEAGSVGMEWVIALNRGDMDRAFGELMAPGALGENRSRTAFPDPSVSDPATSFGDLNAMVGSTRTWPSVLCSLSPNWFVSRLEREAVGRDGETYAWTWLTVSAVREGRFVSTCLFDPEDELAAFAYAEERMRATANRLAVTNRAAEVGRLLIEALGDRDIDAAASTYSEKFVYDDRRRLSGDPIDDIAGVRAAIERIVAQYSQFDADVLAVRGEGLTLARSRVSDDSGNETTDLIVLEVDVDGLIIYEGRFDQDFEGAYRELEKRYYAGEGAEYVEAGAAVTEWTLALNRADFDTLFDELTAFDFRIENRSRSAFPDRSAREYRATLEELTSMVVSARSWSSAMWWLSSNYGVARCERDAVGEDGEHFTWLFLVVFEARDGRVASMCEFELDDEDGAFAYAEERVRATSSRLGLTNQATRTTHVFFAAMRGHDVDDALECCSDGFVYDDRRRISGDPIHDRGALKAAISRILEQYTDFEARTLAVRGENLQLGWSRWSNSAGFETTYLHVVETGTHGRFEYEGRFDEDDFEDAYRELERRYHAGEGVAFAEAGATTTEYMVALNQRNLDRLIGELTSANFCIRNRSRSPFGDRSAAEFRASVENLHAMVAWVRSWESAVCWLSPTLDVSRYEREAVGPDGERYTWTHILVNEIRNGRIESACLFDLDDEEAAFAYAEELVQATTSRLALTNRASETVIALASAGRASDIDAMFGWYSDGFVYDDRRRLSGDPITTAAALRIAQERILEQYSRFDLRTLAVRGERLHLGWGRWSNDAGFETAHLYVHEVGDDGRVVYEGRFDEDDFEGAYRELDRRYYAGEGAAFAEAGATSTDYAIALNQRNFDRVFGELSAPGFRLQNRSRSPFGDRSATEFRANLEELNEMVASARSWDSVVRWLTPTLVVGRSEREAVGHDGERYAWTHIGVGEIHDAQFESVCLFELEDEEAAFAYAEERVRATTSRLAVTNRASQTADALGVASRRADVDGGVNCHANTFVFDDRRRLTGDPVSGAAELRAAAKRIFEQYTQFDWRTLAVRGTRLHLAWSRWADDAGNETGYLHVREVGDDGRFTYEARFDADDFDAAYRELERRYYSGEGAAFANSGAIITDYTIAYNEGDFDKLFGDLTTPGMQFENRSRSIFPDRSVDEFRASVEELSSMVSSARTWSAALCWISTSCCVSRLEREAIGQEGEHYSWTRIYVSEVRNGRVAAVRQFELDDEARAFAYAEEQVRAIPSRLAVTNRSCESALASYTAMPANDIDGYMRRKSDHLVYDDRRRLSGDPIHGNAEIRAAFARVLEQYSHFEHRILAVRGERLNLHWSRWSDAAGNETAYLHVYEIGNDGLQIYEGRFDEDDFEGAYRELDRRYYAGEGAAFAEAGATTTEAIIAYNEGDFDRFLGDLADPEMRFENRSRSVFPDRSLDEFRTSIDELSAMVSSARAWYSAVRWLSPVCGVSRFERAAVGKDGEKYTWSRLYVNEFRGGRATLSRQFDVEDEEQAFAYAEERIRAATSRLAVTNRSCESALALLTAMQGHDVDGIMRCLSDRLVYDDHRRLTGDPINGSAEFRAAFTRILEQYSHFEWRVLAVRGERLNLNWSRWSDAAGNETAYLHVFEIDDDELQVYEGRFDEDDFVGAYRELEQRFYAGEGATFAEAGTTPTEVVIALNRGDFDKAFGEFVTPDAHVENRSRLPFPNRSADVLRASFVELNAMVASARTWFSAMCWVSKVWSIVRFEREALGKDGEQYSWTHLVVLEIHDGRIASMCEFELDDEDAAFAYADERIRLTASRLPTTNRASETANAMIGALDSQDIDRAFTFISDAYVYDDRRRLSGDPIRSHAELRIAVERILAQYNRFEWRTLAVRGERTSLFSSRWSDDAGNETSHLHVFEIDDAGLIKYEGRFDGDDFVGAYRELENRYFAGEGAAFAEAGAVTTDYMIAANRGDLDLLFGDLTAPGVYFENRSRSGFPDRSAPEYQVGTTDLFATMDSVRLWNTATCWLSPTVIIGRQVREARGRDGEFYAWDRLLVSEVLDGRIASACEFELEHEEAAFAYAKEQVRATAGRLTVINLASRVWKAVGRAMRAHNSDGAAALFADPFVYDDRWAVGGDPPDRVRTAVERIFEQYSEFEGHTLAVRGDTLQLARGRWSNEAGYETSYLHVTEIDGDGRISYYGRFDEEDFEGAYRELDRRYYAADGAAFAEAGTAQTEWISALNRGDLDRVFGELTDPDMRFEIRSSSAFPDRSAAELRASLDELNTWVASTQTWHSAMCWLSPTCCVSRNERTAVGRDGEQYAWTRLYAFEIRDGRGVSSCEFEPDDEQAAFAYAEERVRASGSRLAVTNRASRTSEAVLRAMQAHDTDGTAACYSEGLVFDDRRRFAGNPLPDMRTASERVFEQYTQFEGRMLAVRGERLALGWTRWSNAAGFETAYLVLHEIGDDGRIAYQARFDEDDFEGAYRTLMQRYCAGEGAAVAEGVEVGAEWLIAANNSDFDRAFGELTDPEMRVVNRSSSVFPDRSAAELRTGFEELNTMVTASRLWNSIESWLSANVVVCLNEREAVGRDGEKYEWTRIYVFEARDGRCTGLCEFDLDDQEAAFAYAEERVRATASRIAVDNRARRTWDAVERAGHAHDVDAMVACYAEQFEYDDRRRLSGNPLGDVRTAAERVLEQYTQFEARTLAVRGERLHMGWSRWSSDSGYETAYLYVHEIGDDGRFVYEGRFDEDDFEGAYRELDRRYRAGEGAAFAEGAVVETEWLIAASRGDFDRTFGELTDPAARIENRSSSVFPDRSAADLRASFEDLYAMVTSARSWSSVARWLSPNVAVARHERRATGRDGEQYDWTWIFVFEVSNSRVIGGCQFDLEDEAAAFAYAEERVRPAEES